MQNYPNLCGATQRVAIAAFVLLLCACSTVVKVPLTARPDTLSSASSAAKLSLGDAQSGYARVLQRHVNDKGEVNFAALRDDASDSGISALENYALAIAVTPLDAVGMPAARLAHMINAYNALSMLNVVASGIPPTHAGWAKVQFFALRKFDIGGVATSLYAFENDTIRKLNEPRIHFALNCSAVSCPVLPRTPFTAGKLDEELDRETRAFFARPENLRIDDAKRTVFFNEILKFYTEDFTPAHAPSLIAYAQRYTSKSIPPDYAVAFSPYNWTVANSQRPR
jgi:Protein of unknown function, DUF547